MELQDYSPKPIIEGVKIIDLKVHKDDGGSFCELGRFEAFENILLDCEELTKDPLHKGIGDKLQANYSVLHPGTIKAFHLHKNQTDQFCIMDKMIINLIDIRHLLKDDKLLNRFLEASQFRDSLVKTNEMGHLIPKEKRMRLVLENQKLIIPPGVLHGICNPYNQDHRMIYFVNRWFNPQDEWRLPWDLIGEEVWRIQKG